MTDIPPDFSQTTFFKEKNILLIGGTSGIGLTCALQVLQAGANLTVLSRSATYNEELKDIRSNYHTQLTCLDIDISDPSSIANFFNDKLKYNNPSKFNGVIVCSGITMIHENITDITQSKYNEVFNTNTLGPLLFLIHSQPWLEYNSSVVLVSSIASKSPSKASCLYSASKAALDSLATSFADAWSPYQIRVNSILPGITDTPLLNKLGDREEIIKEFSSNIPLKRVASTDEISNLILFLISPLSSYITGQNIIVDGGITSIWNK